MALPCVEYITRSGSRAIHFKVITGEEIKGEGCFCSLIALTIHPFLVCILESIYHIHIHVYANTHAHAHPKPPTPLPPPHTHIQPAPTLPQTHPHTHTHVHTLKVE